MAVLGSIPEPLSPQDRVPPPARGDLPAPARGEIDTSGQADVPIPSPTTALGQRPPAPSAAAPTGGTASPPADTSPRASDAPPPAEPPRQPTRGERDTCWRIQIAASTVRFNAERARSAAEAVLMVPMVVEQEGPYHKTRTRDCMDGETADRLKARAAGAGYPGAFKFPGVRR